MPLRCLHDSSTDPIRLMTVALRFTTVELGMLTMPPRFDTVLVRFKPVALWYRHDLPRMCTIQWLSCDSPRGGGVLLFFFIRRFEPSIYSSPQRYIRNFKHPQKIEILATKKIFPILYLDLKKTPKMYRNDP